MDKNNQPAVLSSKDNAEPNDPCKTQYGQVFGKEYFTRIILAIDPYKTLHEQKLNFA